MTSLFRPFAGLRPAPRYAADVAAPPYDVLNSQEARALAEGRPWSFLHISKPEIDLDPEIDVHAPEVYAKAAENLKKMVKAQVLVRDEAPYFYVYRMIMGDHVQTGVVGAASVAAYDVNRIRKHEFTRPDKEDDRVRQIEAVSAQTGPVLLAHKPNGMVATVIERTTRQAPAYAVTADNGVEHILWVVRDESEIALLQKGFDGMEALYIADGHHRSASASRVCKARGGKGGSDGFLAVSFPVDEMKILDYNRVVVDLNGLDAKGFLAKLATSFTVTPVKGRAKPDQAGVFGMYLGKTWYRLEPTAPLPPVTDPVARLDVSVLTDRILNPILGIADLRRDSRIDFVGGARGLEGLEKRVDSGEMTVAFALFATSMNDLVAVADAEEVMPPKSTWFEPKLADGLVSLVLD